MKRYESYKPSGISWIGEIPSHWEEKRLSAICLPKSISGYQNENLLSVFLGKGIVPFNSESSRRTNAISETTDLTKYQLVEPGDFVLNNQQAWRGSVGISYLRGIVSPAYIVLSFRIEVNPHYCDFALQSNHMISQFFIYSKGVGSIQRNISWNDLKNSIYPIPPLEEQKKIVEYIERKNKAINDMIANLRAEIDFLTEYKQRLIADAVTGQIKID